VFEKLLIQLYNQAQVDLNQKQQGLVTQVVNMIYLHYYNTTRVDSAKAKSNFDKHRVSFDEAKSLFYDELADQFFDEDNSFEEDRFLLLGRSSLSRILMICLCYRSTDNVIQIISARKATKTESKFYRGNK
jgi:uncharacterized DUF497 family protein